MFAPGRYWVLADMVSAGGGGPAQLRAEAGTWRSSRSLRKRPNRQKSWTCG